MFRIPSLLFVFCFFICHLAATQSAIYSDTKFQEWSNTFLEGKHQEVIASLNENLLSSSPHPMASYAWVITHQAMGDLDEAIQNAPSALKPDLEFMHKLVELDENDQPLQLVASYSLDQIKKSKGTYSAYLWGRTIKDIDQELYYQSCLIGLENNGDLFRYAWSIANEFASNNWTLNKATADLEAGVFDKYPATKSFLTRLLRFLPITSYDQLSAVREFRKIAPNDPLSLRYTASQFSTVELYDSALIYYEKSLVGDPFYYPGGSIKDMGYCLAKLNQEDEIKELGTKYRLAYAPSKPDSEVDYLLDAIIRSGNYGLAIERVKEALTTIPESAQIQYRAGVLEWNMGRKAQALIYYRKAVELDPKNVTYRRSLTNTYLSENRLDMAMSEFTKVEQQVELLNPSLYHMKADIFMKAEDYAEASNIYLQALKKFPHSVWIKRNFAYVSGLSGKTDVALRTVLEAIDQDANNSWSYYRLAEYLQKKYPTIKAEQNKVYYSLIDKYPWQQMLWRQIVNNTEGTNEKIKVWETAAQRNPNRFMPFNYENMEALMRKGVLLDDYRAKLKAIQDGIFTYGSLDDQLNFYFQLGYTTRDKLAERSITKEGAMEGIVCFQKYIELGGRPGGAYQNMADMHHSIGNKEKASEYARKSFLSRPDTEPLALITKYEGARGFALEYEWMMRDPYNRAKRFADISVKWSGSPISALWALRKYDVDDAYTTNFAYKLLGNSTKMYEDYYANANNLGHERYIGWYNDTRKNAWEGGTQLQMDYETNTASILFEDGTIALRQDDIRLGQIRKVQVGDVWIAANYNDVGDLTKLETSGGQSVSLFYDTSNHINRMTTSEGEELGFEYNELGKASKIEIKSVGRIEVTYDEYGSILETKSFDAQGNEGGSAISIKVSEAMQELMRMANLIKEGHSVSSGQLPDLGIVQPQYAKLQEQWYDVYNRLDAGENSKLRIEWFQKSLGYVEYLIKNTHVSASYGTEAANVLSETYQWCKDNTLDAKTQPYAVRTIELFHELMLKIRRRGVALDYWNTWADMKEWLQLEKISQTKLTKYRSAIEVLQDKIQKQPIELLATSEWLPKSFLQNDGFWKQYSIADIIPREHKAEAIINCMLYRTNGDLLVGTSKGLGVLRRGYWEWFGFNSLKSEWQSELPASRLTGSSNILSLAETDEGKLLIGTSEGLLMISGDYRGKQSQRFTDAEGLPSSIVTHLVPAFDRIFIGTPKGAVWLASDKITPVVGLPQSLPIMSARFRPAYFVKSDPETEEYFKKSLPHQLYVSNADGVFEGVSLLDYSFEKVVSGTRTDLIVASDGLTYFLRNNELIKLTLTNDAKVELPITGNIITSQANGIYGLANVPINEFEEGLAVLTDVGFSFYHENHFEHFYLPGKDKAKGLVNGLDQSFAGWSDRGVWVFEKDNAQTIDGNFTDILTVNELGLTFLADGASLKYIIHRSDSTNSNQPLEWGLDIIEHDYYGNTSTLAVDAQKRLIANDGQFIKRYTWDAEAQLLNEENLFHANQFEPTSGEKYQGGGVRNIVVAKDGTIWVATKMSVFRYREVPNGEPIVQEYNYFRDQSRFPAPAHMIYRIFETNDGRIRVVASNEGHLYYQGASLKGGYMEWSPVDEKFVLLNTENLAYNWVVHSYTPISENEAILGTTNGFARDKNGHIQHFGHSLKSPSYLELSKEHPNVFLGTRGTKIGDLWVFGSGAGVVAYHQGRWFYPERLNQMLPKDLELKNYGSRHVNAIDVDVNGRLYVGTDLGLLILDGQGDGAASFLLENDTPERAFEYASVQTVMAESESILSDLKLPDNSANLLIQIRRNQAEMNRLEQQLAGSQPNRMMVAPSKERVDSLNNLITNKQKEHVQLLLQLETSDPAIHQLLSIKPVEIASIRKQFKPDQCVVQYIPTKQRLYIQVLSKNEAILKEVGVSQDSLMKMCQGVSNLLKHEVKGEVLTDRLARLYDLLLRPIADDIEAYDHVQLIPVMSMYYVPFAALINRVSESEWRYAVEEHQFGYVSSTNLLSLLMTNPKSGNDGILLMGDADGSLPAARDEVKEIGNLVTNKVVLTGNEVTLTNLLKNAGNAGIIHLATHGFLNEKVPSKSNILMAQDKRLSLPEAFNLPLGHTDMVVLSACETGKGGGSGLEYATMARAFTNAGASTVLATLWKVNDAATKELMVRFYSHLLAGDDKFTALANAQRELIASGNDLFTHPNRWASFVPMGEP